MVPAENLSKHHHHHHLVYYGHGCGGSYSDNVGLMSRTQQGYDYSSSDHQVCLGSDNPMAEDESRTNSILNDPGNSSSKENQEEKDEGWLQLSIGSCTKTSYGLNYKHHDEVDPTARRGGLIELDLLAGAGSQASPLPSGASATFQAPADFPSQWPVMNMGGASSFSSSLFFQKRQQQQQEEGSSSSATFPHQQKNNWEFKPIVPQNIASSSSSSIPYGSYFARPFQVHTGLDVAGPSSDFRIIDPPRRPHSGIWFMLLALQNQAEEPFLPQIPKSYIRIKDGRMTVRLLIKYLVNKLKLASESEIEIRCRGQQLLPFLTLQHVRDNIWSPREDVTLLPVPETSTTDHLMVLHYSTTASNS